MNSKLINSKKIKGEFNSSITRVRPVFQQLIHQKNNDWLSNILSLFSSSYSELVAKDTGSITPEILIKKPYKDKILKQEPFNVSSILLEKCFECKLPPPEDFLLWLIENPSHLKWPVKGKQKTRYKHDTEKKRNLLIEGDDSTQQEAYNNLKQFGAIGSSKKWWAFEGFTEVDCLIETDKIFLAIEGKRTEIGPSKMIDWFPQRNQIVRNLEALKQKSTGKPFALILVKDEEQNAQNSSLTLEHFRLSLPHYTMQRDIEDLMTHYLGSLTWRQICDATGINYNHLPRNIYDVVKKLEKLDNSTIDT